MRPETVRQHHLAPPQLWTHILDNSDFSPLCVGLWITAEASWLLTSGSQIHFSKQMNLHIWNLPLRRTDCTFSFSYPIPLPLVSPALPWINTATLLGSLSASASGFPCLPYTCHSLSLRLHALADRNCLSIPPLCLVPPLWIIPWPDAMLFRYHLKQNHLTSPMFIFLIWTSLETR